MTGYLREAFRHFGREVPYEHVRHQIGKGGDQLMPVFFFEEELNRFGEEMEEYRGELYKRHYLPLVRPFPRCANCSYGSAPTASRH